MKTVFTNSMCAHVWAQRSQERGQGSKGSIYFQGDTIYSYGPHFRIAMFVDRPPAETVVLINRDNCSVSTAKHINYVRRAIPHGVPVFHVLHVDAGRGKANLDDYYERIEAALSNAHRARSHTEWKLERAIDLTNEARNFAKFFGLPFNEPVTDKEAFQAKIAAQRAEATRKRKAQDERNRLARIEAEAKFRAGESIYNDFGDIMLRVRGDVIETSRGATVPLDQARYLFKNIKTCRDTETEYRANGHTIYIGDFRIDHIEPNGNLRAGCHYITWPEIARTAQELGWL